MNKPYVKKSGSDFVIGNRFLERTVGVRKGRIETTSFRNKLTGCDLKVTSRELLLKINDTVTLSNRDFTVTGTSVENAARGGRRAQHPDLGGAVEPHQGAGAGAVENEPLARLGHIAAAVRQAGGRAAISLGARILALEVCRDLGMAGQGKAQPAEDHHPRQYGKGCRSPYRSDLSPALHGLRDDSPPRQILGKGLLSRPDTDHRSGIGCIL